MPGRVEPLTAGERSRMFRPGWKPADDPGGPGWPWGPSSAASTLLQDDGPVLSVVLAPPCWEHRVSRNKSLSMPPVPVGFLGRVTGPVPTGLLCLPAWQSSSVAAAGTRTLADSQGSLDKPVA